MPTRRRLEGFPGRWMTGVPDPVGALKFAEVSRNLEARAVVLKSQALGGRTKALALSMRRVVGWQWATAEHSHPTPAEGI